MAEGLNASDVALMSRCDDGWGNGMGFMWIFALLILANGGFGGWGNNGFQNAIGYENLATSNEIQRGFDNQNSMANEREILASINSNALQGMQNANQNTQYMMAAFNDKYAELQRDISGIAMGQQQAIFNQQQCCCDIKQTIMAEANATRAMIQQDKIEALRDKVQGLEMQNAMAGVIRYPMSTSYNAGYNPFCNCNGVMA